MFELKSHARDIATNLEFLPYYTSKYPFQVIKREDQELPPPQIKSPAQFGNLSNLFGNLGLPMARSDVQDSTSPCQQKAQCSGI